MADKRIGALSRQLLVQIFIWSAMLVTLVTSIAFWAAYERASSEQLRQLAETATQRVQLGSTVFREAEQTTRIFSELFIPRYQRLKEDPTLVARFDSWMEETEPGVLRLSRRFFAGTIEADQLWQYLTIFMGPASRPRDDELKSRVMITLDLLNELGPAWTHQFANTHVSMPDNVLLTYWPDSAWGLLARPDLDITQYAVVGSTLQSNNPDRLPNWTGLYFDESAGHWVITYQHPVDVEGKHLITPSHDVYLNEVMATLVGEGTDTVDYFIFNQQRQLIAGPAELMTGKEYVGEIDLDKIDDPKLPAIYDAIVAVPPTTAEPVQFINLDATDSFIAVTEVAGPGWWHVTSYPRALIHKQALYASIWVAGLGLALLLLVLTVVLLFIRGKVSQPIHQLKGAAEAVGNGRYQAVANGEVPLPLATNNEIGLLAGALRDMASHISVEQETLEGEVLRRTRQLEEANHQLGQMAHIDGLTDLLNRRALDRDISQLCKSKTSRLSALIMADVDHFKNYNDSYGHEAGDNALKQIAHAFMLALPKARIYRYGGEEMVVLVPVSDEAESLQSAERLRTSVLEVNMPHAASAHHVVTVSFGVTLLQPGDTPNDLLRRADKALYQAKDQGRNTVILK